MSLTRRRKRQQGMSLVELMVGITIGLIVVAGASVLLSGQLVENRRLVVEAQVQQDLRATADIITRELRRSGAIGLDEELVRRVWSPGSVDDPEPNQYSAALTPATGGVDIRTDFSYMPIGAGTEGPFGFRLRPGSGKIETFLRNGGWQDLTDPSTITVTEFEVERLDDTQTRIPCGKPCPDGTSACWPTVSVRTLEVRITARARSDPTIVRSFRSQVRVRNNHLSFFSAAALPARAVCPT